MWYEVNSRLVWLLAEMFMIIMCFVYVLDTGMREFDGN